MQLMSVFGFVFKCKRRSISYKNTMDKNYNYDCVLQYLCYAFLIHASKIKIH
jgi:hypothetical protein